MNKKFIGLASLLVLSFNAISCGDSNYHPKVLFDYVCDLETNQNFDEEKAVQNFEKFSDGWNSKSGCSCLVKQLSNGEVIVGRNYDFYISNCTMFVGKIKGSSGFYNTMFTQYNILDNILFETVKNNGISKELLDVLAISATDVMNEKGLYIEYNMRISEPDETGKDKFGVEYTNKNASVRLCTPALPQYIARRAKDVEEAINLITEIDWHSPKGDIEENNLNQGITLVDASGDSATVEFGMNSLYINRGNTVSTNFYTNPEWRAIEKYASGTDRYRYLSESAATITSEEDLDKVMKNIKYSSAYNWDNGIFDVRSEFVNAKEEYTIDYVLNDDNKEELKKVIHDDYYVPYTTLSEKELRESKKYWKSIFTNVSNCTNKTIKVTFEEDESKTITYKFD